MKLNQLKHFRKVIYKLSKDYAFKLDLYRFSEETDFITGMKIVNRERFHIKKALILPNRMYREFSYLGFNTGIFDVHERHILINKRELPRDFKIQETDYLVLNHKKYEFKDITEMELVDFWYLTVKKIEGQPIYEIHDRLVRDRLKFEDTINVSKS